LLPTIRVLVVDDYEGWRRQTCLLLQARPELEVICEAADGSDAVEKAGELKPDLILLDIGLPKLDGIEASRRIRRISPNSRIIFLSQDNSLDVVQAALGTGALGYVYKIDARSELLRAVDAVLRGNPYVSNSLKGYEFSDKPGEKAPHRREVLLWPDDAVLLDSFTHVIAAALKTGNAAIVMATESHQDNLLQRLKKRGLDVGHAIQEGTYVALNVTEVLSEIMVSGLPDPVRFFAGISGFIETATKASKAPQPRVVVCGEGVAMLRAEGKAAAANRLEQLCNELAKTHAVDVLCAFPC
jgi:DNA-binding NarL/FixJ family response regulator